VSVDSREASTGGTGGSAAAKPSAARRVRNNVLRFGMIWALVGLVILTSILYPGFFDPGNINNVFSQVAPTGIVAVGMTYVILAGGFDLSVAAIFASATVLYASLADSVSLPLAFVITVVICTLMGAINGFIVTVMGVNPFIATLSTSSLFLGAATIYSNSGPVIPNNPSFSSLGLGKIAGISNANYFLVAFLIVFGVILARTTYGRMIYSVGGNREASRLAGIRVNWVTVSTYMVTGLCASVGGMILASMSTVGQSSLGGTVTLDSIAIVIIGGTSLMGGEGAMWRTLVGLSIWGVLSNLFNSVGLSAATQLLMQGAILLFAVFLDVLSRKYRR